MNKNMRIEKDNIGELEIIDDALFGIHTFRSLQNFPLSGERIDPNLIKGFLQVKKAAAETNYKIKILSKPKYLAIRNAIDSLLEEMDNYFKNADPEIYYKILVDPYQGGAGTSLNMNINEVIANTALVLSGKKPGEYSSIHPLDDVNLSQSTNDTFPTALRIASIVLLRQMQESFSTLQNELQKKENEFADILKLGRTQMQDAVPISLGQEFGAYAQAIARDRWRFYNAEERLRSVNLGGTAVGNSITAQNQFVLNVVNELREITELPLAKAEDLIENTQNLDVFVEVHGIIKAGATSIQKISNDLRILSSGPDGGIGEIILPKKQAGSSIMPGKINPVILENSIQLCELVKGHDVMISNLVSAGNLELNQFMPMIAHLFLKSLTMLKNTAENLAENCIAGIRANRERCTENLIRSKAIAAALIPVYGYDKISEIISASENSTKPFYKLLMENLNIDKYELSKILTKELGISIEFGK